MLPLPKGLVALGDTHRKGLGVKNTDKAVDVWLVLALSVSVSFFADVLDISAQFYKQAAGKPYNDAMGQFMLGECHQYGWGTKPDMKAVSASVCGWSYSVTDPVRSAGI